MILSAKNKRVDVIGAGGHARAVIALLERCEYGVEGVYDESYRAGTEELISGVKLRGTKPPGDKLIALAVGVNEQRAAFAAEYNGKLLTQSVVDPTAIIAKDVVMGNSNFVMARVTMNAEARIGNNNIINTGAVLEHETVIGDNNHISVGAILCGRVKLGSNCFVGAGATIIDKLTVCDNVTIGAGAVVIRNITEPGTYVGNPARRTK